MKKNAILILKSIICLLVAFTFVYSAGRFDKNSLYDYSAYQSSEDIPEINNSAKATRDEAVCGSFTVQGSILDSVRVFVWKFAASSPTNVTCVLFDSEGRELQTAKNSLSAVAERQWCTFNFDCEVVSGADYTFRITTDTEDSYVDLIIASYDPSVTDIELFELVFSTRSYDKEFDAMRVIFYVLELLFVGFVTAICSYSVFNFESLYAVFTKSGKKKGALPSILLALILVFMSDPLDRRKLLISDSVGQIGAGVSNNYDYNAAITELYFVFASFVLAFGLIFLYLNAASRKNEDEELEKSLGFLNSFSIIALSALLLYSIRFFAEREAFADNFSYTTALIALFIVFELVYSLGGLYLKLSHAAYLRIFFFAFAASFLVYPLMPSAWSAGRLSILMLALILGAAITVILCSAKIRESKPIKAAFDLLSCAVCFAPLFVSLFIETLHLLNQSKIFVSSPTAVYAITLAVTVFVLAAMVIARLRFGVLKLVPREKIFMPVLLVGLVFLSVQPPFSSVVAVNIFEDANFSVLASDFLNYGKIPLVEHYGGHMLESVFESIFWMLFNQTDVIFANPYLQTYLGIESVKIFTPLVVLIAYKFLCMFCDEKDAFFITLLLPTVNLFGYFAVGLIVVFALAAYMKKRTLPRAFLLWISCAIAAIYRLDIGMAFGVAAVITVAYFLFKSKSKKEFKDLSISFASVIAFFAVLWVALCLLKGVGPIDRLKEFLSISLSNYNWAHSTLGDSELALFAVAYLILPLSMVALLLYVLLSEKCKKLTDERRAVLLTLAISYFANFSRSCVRHSVVELGIHVVLWTAVIFVAALVSDVFDAKSLLAPILACGLFLSMLLTGNADFVSGSTLDGISQSYGEAVSTWQKPSDREELSYWEALAEEKTVVDRVVLSEDTQRIYKPFASFFDEFLDEDDTFLDFANCSHLYAMLGLESPVYVSQSPLQLADDFSQKMFVEQLEGNIENMPFAIMPYDIYTNNPSIILDGIPNSYRYYRCSEFVYKNYKPLCIVEEVSVWVRSDLYERMYLKVASLNDSGKYEYTYELINDEYYSSTFVPNVGSLPYIFGKYEKPENEVNISEVSAHDGRIYKIDSLDALTHSEGVYLKFTAEYVPSDSDAPLKTSTVSIAFGTLDDTTEKIETARTFMLDIHEGEGLYYIRISTDYAWTRGEITHLDIDSSGNVNCSDFSLVIFE